MSDNVINKNTKVTEEHDPFREDADNLLALVKSGATQQAVADWLQEFGGKPITWVFTTATTKAMPKGITANSKGTTVSLLTAGWNRDY